MPSKRDVERRLGELEAGEERERAPFNITIGDAPDDADVEPIVIPYGAGPAADDDDGGGSA